MDQNEKLDLVILADSTHSMVEVQKSIKETISQAFHLAALTGVFHRIGLLWYTDYTLVAKYPVTTWSGWCSALSEISSCIDSADLYPGGDEPEACKTALAEVLSHVEQKTCLLWYGDSAPHHPSNDDGHPNYTREEKQLKRTHGAFDWIQLCRQARDKNCIVCPIVNTDDHRMVTPFFMLLATVTGGQAHSIPPLCPAEDITRETIKILLSMLTPQTQPESDTSPMLAKRLCYKKDLPVIEGRDENSLPGYLPCSLEAKGKAKGKGSGKTTLPATQIIPSLSPSSRDAVLLIRQGIRSKDLRRRFASDLGYVGIVLGVMRHITSYENGILALTYNPIFSCLWREAVRDKSNSGLVKQMNQQFNRTLNRMEATQRLQVRQWLEASYDASEEIEDAIADAIIDTHEPYPALVLQSVEAIRPQELTSIASTCDRKTLSRMIDLLANVQVANGPVTSTSTSTSTIRVLPLALPDDQLIPMLPHLMCKGLVFSARSAAILAILAVLSRNAALHTRARSYLELMRGKWIDFEKASNYSYGFTRLMMKAEKMLTHYEATRMSMIRDLQGLLMNSQTDINVSVPRMLQGKVLPDFHSCCKRCGHFRSRTLMNHVGWCGPCALGYEIEDSDNHSNVNPGAVDPGIIAPSTLFDCHKCSVRYAVLEVKDLNLKKVKPKCHYCRQGCIAPTVVCATCNVAYAVHLDADRVPGTSYTCASCHDPASTAQTGQSESFETTIRAIYDEHPRNRTIIMTALDLDIVNVGAATSLFSSSSNGVFPLRKAFKKVPIGDPMLVESRELIYKGKRVINTSATLGAITDWVRKHKAELGMCMMCCDELSKEALITACGRRGCTIKCCQPCVRTWYSYLQRGHLLPPANLLCPFCKRAPSPKVLCRHNRAACELLRARPPGGYDAGWYYGWCENCMRPRPWMEKVCAQEGPQGLGGGFRCESCQHINMAQQVNARDCPKCQVTCEKTMGCDHITCRCGAHWCWRCGQECTPRTIYTHIGGCRGDEIFAAFVAARDNGAPLEYDEGAYDDDDDEYYDDY